DVHEPPAAAPDDHGTGFVPDALHPHVAGAEPEAVVLVMSDDRAVAFLDDGAIGLADDRPVAFAGLPPLVLEILDVADLLAARRPHSHALAGSFRLDRFGI